MTPLARVLWHSPDAIPIAVAMAALLASAVLWLYPPQTRDLPRLWRWGMPALRGMAVAALVIALVRPVVLRPRTATREAPIVVLADASASMSIVDGGDRTPAERVALAAGLEALPSGVVRPQVAPALRGQLDGIAAAIDQVARARTESDYARLSERGGGVTAARLRDALEHLRGAIAALADQQPIPELIPRVAALKASPPRLDPEVLRSLRGEVDAAARALDGAQGQADEKLYREDARVRATCDQIASLSRARLLEAALKGREANGVMAKLPAGVAVQAFAFAGEVKVIGEALSSGGIALDGRGAQSDLAGALRAALRLAPIGGHSATTTPPQAILLFSDGRQVGGDGEGLLSDLSAAGVPVFAVQVAAPASPRRDLSIVRVDAPPAARVGQTVLVRVEVRGVGLRGLTVDVRLDAGNVRQLRRVTLGGEESSAAAAASAVAEFDVQLPRSGPQRLSASVLALPDEITDRNNQFDTWINVGAEAAKVMVIAAETAGRQYASLHAALSPPQWISLREIDDSSQYRALWARSILDQDVIVLIDLPPDVLDEEQWVAIEQAVRERGASVILCAGQALPEEYVEHPDAEIFLPYDPLVTRPAWRTWPGGETQFRVAPSAEWESAQQREGVSVDREFWRQLAPLSRMLPIARLRPPARAMLVERDGAAAVMTEMAMGLGRVFFIATDQSWRWRGSGPGSAAREREQFWPQLVRLAARKPFVAVTNTGLKLDVDNVAPEPQQPIVVRAQALDSYGLPVEAATQTLQVLHDGSTALAAGGSTPRQVTLNSRAQGSGQFEGTIEGLSAGDYVLRLDPPEDLTGEFPPDPVELPLRVAPRFEAELADLSPHERFLRRIAEASGGQFLSLDQLDTLPQRLEENRRKLAPLVEYALWDSPYLFVFVLACLSAEWALRKKFALA
jgi:hypothetical protein